MNTWRYLRPALQPLRGSTRYAIFGLACIAIAGCSEPPSLGNLEAEPIHYQTVGSYATLDCGDPCRVARLVVADGYLTHGEYDTVIAAVEAQKDAQYRATMNRIKSQGE